MTETIKSIPLDELHPFPDHPFGVRDDEAMQQTVESIKKYGVLVPAIARPREDGGYEIIAGHRRKHACELAGLKTMPVIVRDVDRNAATIIMVDSNLQRENILPSERAKAYKMKLEAIKRQDFVGEGGTTEQNGCSPLGGRSGAEFVTTQRKGLGTPATRAGIIEKLIATGFVERKKAKKNVNLIPAGTGVSLITVLPEQLQSPLLTAEWEHKLKLVEHGELDADEFMAEISHMVSDLVKTYTAVKGAEVLFPSGREVIGKCPRCGGDVTESKKGFFCETNSCRFGLWRDNKFLTAKKIPMTKKTAATLLKNGRIPIKGIYSEKTGNSYDATLVMTDDGAKTLYSFDFGK